MKVGIYTFCIAMLLLFSACAQESPYAGQEKRDIKALSAADIAGLKAGRGMGLARVAELNGYPGPKHVLELGDELQLSAAQRSETQQIYEAMHEAAVATGEQIIGLERQLENAFQQSQADAAAVEKLIADIAVLQGALRFFHIRAHLQMMDVLNAEQVAAYSQLRGYAAVEHDGASMPGH